MKYIRQEKLDMSKTTNQRSWEQEVCPIYCADDKFCFNEGMDYLEEFLFLLIVADQNIPEE